MVDSSPWNSPPIWGDFEKLFPDEASPQIQGNDGFSTWWLMVVRILLMVQKSQTTHPFGCFLKPNGNNGDFNCQPQLVWVYRISEPSTVSLFLGMTWKSTNNQLIERCRCGCKTTNSDRYQIPGATKYLHVPKNQDQCLNRLFHLLL